METKMVKRSFETTVEQAKKLEPLINLIIANTIQQIYIAIKLLLTDIMFST